jgi:hypothetical protein
VISLNKVPGAENRGSLNLNIQRGPLSTDCSDSILREYNRLTRSRIPLSEFLHWVQRSPAGPAWHATLTTDEGRLVGHTSLFPFTTQYGARPITPAKSEYSFVHEDFRKTSVRGFETSALPPFMILLAELLKVGERVGWAPIFASTGEKNQPFSQRLGLLPAEFNVRECLFVMRPINAAKFTPNLGSGQRAALFCAGSSQKMLWVAARAALARANGIRSVPVDEEVACPERSRIAFFEEPRSLRWRYGDGDYVRLSSGNPRESYVIAKKGGPDRYLRVCQWALNSADPLRSYFAALLRQAKREKALGVRWALYENDGPARAILNRARRMGFVTVKRVRVVMVHKREPEFLTAATWRINDSLFSFDP